MLRRDGEPVQLLAYVDLAVGKCARLLLGSRSRGIVTPSQTTPALYLTHLRNDQHLSVRVTLGRPPTGLLNTNSRRSRAFLGNLKVRRGITTRSSGQPLFDRSFPNEAGTVVSPAAASHLGNA